MPHHSDDDDTDEPQAVPLRRARPFRRLRALARLAAAIGLIAALSVLAREAMVAPAGGSHRASDPGAASAFVPSSAIAARPAVALSASGPRFRLDDPDALDPVSAEPSRLNPTSGQREDSLSQGGFPAFEAPYLRLTVSDGAIADPAPSLFVTIARRAAAGQGLSVTRTGERGRIETKFGAVETLEATLGGAVTRTCTGFASTQTMPIRIDGWLCAPLGQPPEPRAIVCALDKLVLNGQAYPALDVAFRGFEERRDQGCRAAAPSVAAREAAGETGSIARRRNRENEAKLRRTAQARP